MMPKKLVVALGGNAILSHKEEGTAEEQFQNVYHACSHLVDLVKEGYHMVITHGNGPQVGDILLQNEASRHILPPMPLDVCGAESQGMIGYMLQQSMNTVLKEAGIEIPVVTLLTQTLVDQNDPAFSDPGKPIGPFYTAREAAILRKERDWKIIKDSGRGFRRVVPSPKPVSIIEAPSIMRVFESGGIVIACGGGGIPVIQDPKGRLTGVEAVIDKDHSSALLATLIGAEILLILTDVEKVALHYGKANQRDMNQISLIDAKKYLHEGHFPPGSMGPKIESAIEFLESGGKKTIITSLDLKIEALRGNAGTTITP
jgi:carbamate kinase